MKKTSFSFIETFVHIDFFTDLKYNRSIMFKSILCFCAVFRLQHFRVDCGIILSYAYKSREEE